jgi:hypothetical protein
MLSIHFSTWATKPVQKTHFRQYSCAWIKTLSTVFVTYCITSSLVYVFWKVCSVPMKWFYVEFYCAHMLSMAALQIPTLFWTLMTSFDFRHVPTFLPPLITLKCTCICEYEYANGLELNSGNSISWGERIELGFELRVSYLLGRCSYHLRQSSSPLLISSFEIGS